MTVVLLDQQDLVASQEILEVVEVLEAKDYLVTLDFRDLRAVPVQQVPRVHWVQLVTKEYWDNREPLDNLVHQETKDRWVNKAAQVTLAQREQLDRVEILDQLVPWVQLAREEMMANPVHQVHLEHQA